MFRRSRGKDGDPSRPDAAELDEAELDDPGLDDPELDDENPDEGDEPGQHRDSGPDLGDPATWTRLRAPGRAAASPRAGGGGPWDAGDSYPEGNRVDLGSILVPLGEGSDIQVNMDEQAGMWIAVVRPEGALQLQAFAAPKTSGLWDDVRAEIAAEVAKAGGKSEPAQGPFGTELLARMAPPGQPAQALRFVGIDGPRWFLRGLVTGPAAEDPAVAGALEQIFADVVVVRGDHPEPPRKALDIRLPDEARQALEQQIQAEQEGSESGRFAGEGMPSPFERGPEITETR